MSQQNVFTTMCPMNCHPTLCGMRVAVQGGAIVSIVGDQTNPDSQGFLCMRGKAAHEIVGNEKRLLTPLMRAERGGDNWQVVPWGDALDKIAGQMQAVGREAVGFWQGHGNWANDYAFGLKRAQMDRFATLYGCQVWNPAMICWGLGGFGVGLTGAIETSTKEDLGENADLVILWGVNTVSQAATLRHVEIAKRRGARIVVVDVRRTEASALADEVVLVRPGTDTALALAMMHVIIQDKAWDRCFVHNHTDGFGDLVRHLQPMTPRWAQTITGVPHAVIAALARSYVARAISCLLALTGNFGRPGGGIGLRPACRRTGSARL